MKNFFDGIKPHHVIIFMCLLVFAGIGVVGSKPPTPVPINTPEVIHPDVFTAIKPTVLKDPLIGLTQVMIGGKKYSYIKMPNKAEIFTPQEP